MRQLLAVSELSWEVCFVEEAFKIAPFEETSLSLQRKFHTKIIKMPQVAEKINTDFQPAKDIITGDNR